MTGIIAFLIVFGILVVVHEFGHFWMAKKAGVRIREFAIGMGPKLFQTRKGGVTYTIRILPVGGYVRMAGRAEIDVDELQPGMAVNLQVEDQEVLRINLSERTDLLANRTFIVDQADLVDQLLLQGYWEEDDQTYITLAVNHDAVKIEQDGTEVLIAPRDTHFESAKLWQRALINFAGPLMNFILAVVVFLGLAFAMPGVSTTTVGTVQQNSPAAKSGLQVGDKITAINGQHIISWSKLQETIQSKPNKKVTLEVERDRKLVDLAVSVKAVKQDGQTYGQVGIVPKQSTAVADRLNYGISTTGRAFTTIWSALRNLGQGGFSLNKLGGPVSIYKNTATVATFGILSVISFMAWLSVNLGLMNLLPIPGLDGGKLLLNLVEAIMRKPIPEKVETTVTIVGAGFLVILMLAVTGNDIFRYFIR